MRRRPLPGPPAKWAAENACAGKVRHVSQIIANRAARQLREVGKWDGRAMNVYRCIHCGYWHLGHVAAGRTRRDGDDFDGLADYTFCARGRAYRVGLALRGAGLGGDEDEA